VGNVDADLVVELARKQGKDSNVVAGQGLQFVKIMTKLPVVAALAVVSVRSGFDR
jgi:hypothetical protein